MVLVKGFVTLRHRKHKCVCISAGSCVHVCTQTAVAQCWKHCTSEDRRADLVNHVFCI